MKKRFTVESTVVAQVKYYETLYKIKDDNGQLVFTGDKEMADKILKMLNKEKPKTTKKPKKPKGRSK